MTVSGNNEYYYLSFENSNLPTMICVIYSISQSAIAWLDKFTTYLIFLCVCENHENSHQATWHRFPPFGILLLLVLFLQRTPPWSSVYRLLSYQLSFFTYFNTLANNVSSLAIRLSSCANSAFNCIAVIYNPSSFYLLFLCKIT